MKIVNVNGRLETSGTWEETEAQATAQVACIAQQRAELRAMLSGNRQFHEDPHAAAPVVHIGVDIGAPGGDCTAVVLTYVDADGRRVIGPIHATPAAPKPPAVWRTAAQIPESERHGLWFCKPEKGVPGYARRPQFDGSVLYLCAPEGVEFGTEYDTSMYQQPDADGWFTHDPREDSVCPVPAGVEFDYRLRGGGSLYEDPRAAVYWRLLASGHHHHQDIVAWRVVA